jgi:hypothetical protein
MSLNHFLLLYDTKRQTLLDALPFGEDAETAASCYAEKEKVYRDRDDVEIVLLGADSLDTLRQTHPHYFDRTGTDFFTLVTAE